MKKDVLRLWVEDLETTDARQGHGYLAQTTTDYIGTEPSVEYCCLGRLCAIAVKAGVIQPPTWIDARGLDTTVAVYGENDYGEPETAVLPDVVRRWAGLDEPDPILDDGDPDLPIRASELNDTYDKTFREIARFIRDKFDIH